MRLLFQRFEGLRSLPFVELAELPTPVQRVEHVSAAADAEVWCKRDDLTASLYGGNKVRKLEWILGEARGRSCDSLITVGATGSHHILATAVYGARHGFDVHAALFPQPWNEHVEENVRAVLAAGATLHLATSYAGMAWRVLAVARGLRRQGKRPHIVGPGGSSPVGAIGYVEAGLEVAAQIEEGVLPEPSAVFVAAGSGGTVVGASIGLAAAGITCPVVGVRVTDRIAINRPLLAILARRTVDHLRRFDDRFPAVADMALRNIEIDSGQIGRGYGVETEAGQRATALAAQDGLTLDPTYTSKALAGLIARAAGRRALFWLTLSGADMAPLLEQADPAPDWVRAHAAKA